MKDRQREARLTPYGWVLERCTWYDLRVRQHALLVRVVDRAAGRRLA